MLISEQTGSAATSYTSDGRGNRATMTVGNDITSYEYDRTNRLMSETVSELGAAKKVTEYDPIRFIKSNSLTLLGK